MAVRKKRSSSWAQQWTLAKAISQAGVSVVSVFSVPVGAYVYLLTSINSIRSDLESKIDRGFGKIDADMKVLIERQDNTERRVSDLRDDLAIERMERVRELQELRRQGQR